MQRPPPAVAFRAAGGPVRPGALLLKKTPHALPSALLVARALLAAAALAGTAPAIPATSELPVLSLPEPATLVVVGAGIVGLAVFSRRRRNGRR